MKSPTQRSKEILTENGWHPEVVEHWNAFTRRRHDMFGFTDILAIKAWEKPMLVQTTTGTNFAARKAKIVHSDLAPIALRSGFRIFVHGWRKLKVKRGGKAIRWVIRCEEITLADFPPEVAAC